MVVCNWTGVGQQVPVCVGGFGATVLYSTVQHSTRKEAGVVCMYICM